MVNDDFWKKHRITEYFNENTLIDSFSDLQMEVIHERLFKLFLHNSLKNGRSGIKEYLVNFSSFMNFFGLPYVSSGDFAALWNTNAQYLTESEFELKFFAIDNRDNLIVGAQKYNAALGFETWRYYDLGKYYDFGREIF